MDSNCLINRWRKQTQLNPEHKLMTDGEDDEGEEQVKLQTSDVFEDTQFESR